MAVTDQDIQEILEKDEAGVAALLDTYLPAEQLYLEAAAQAASDPVILTATTTTPLK